MDSLEIDAVRPAPFKGGGIEEYSTEILSNGGFGTRHHPTNHVLPHVLSDAPAEEVKNKLSEVGGSGQMMNPSQMVNLASALQSIQGLQIANLGVGLLNLGVNAWTAWKVTKMDGKLDRVEQGVDRIEQKVDGLASFVESSVEHLDQLVRGNAAMLGLLIEGQSHISESITKLRSEVAEGFQSVEERLASMEERSKARRLGERMQTLLQYYRSCSDTMKAGNEPSENDVRSIVDKATTLISTLKTQIEGLPKTAPRRFPLFVAWGFALKLETEARFYLDENYSAQEAKRERFLKQIGGELRSLTEGRLYERACEHRDLVEQYVYLHRAMRGSVSTISLPDGDVKAFYPDQTLEWDDGLERAHDLLTQSSSSRPSTIPLQSLSDHDAWEELAGLPTGQSDEEVSFEKFAEAVGLPEDAFVSEEEARKLIQIAPSAISNSRKRVENELQ